MHCNWFCIGNGVLIFLYFLSASVVNARIHAVLLFRLYLALGAELGAFHSLCAE